MWQRAREHDVGKRERERMRKLKHNPGEIFPSILKRIKRDTSSIFKGKLNDFYFKIEKKKVIAISPLKIYPPNFLCV